jgi:hypothetical protein
MRKMPIGIQSFEKLRTGDFVYVDKTEYVYQLVNGSSTYFLGRPRRFGKSLFLSTLEAYFLGQKELFEGLAIEKLEQDWVEYPVFHIDLNVGDYSSVEGLDVALDANLRVLEYQWGKDPLDTVPMTRFKGLIQRAYEKTGRKVVVLIDEYDKPLLGSIEEEKINTNIRNHLKSFYGVLKSADQWLKFVLLTGVTKFSQVSVFSDLNQLQDISMNRKYAGICGITYEELTQTFAPELHEFAEENNLTYEEVLAEMEKRYNGYHFAKSSVGVFNPFSLLNTFVSGDFLYYWFKTGTPTFLVKLLKETNFNILEFQNGVSISPESIDDYQVGGNDPVPILYQSGYLTIKDYDAQVDQYILGFPNEEVKYGFLKALLPYYTNPKNNRTEFDVAEFWKDLRAHNVDGFMVRLRALFASIPYELNDKTERHYQVVFYLLFTLLGQYTQAEVHSAIGRADAVVKLSNAIYVFEFKLARDEKGKTAEDALAQIDKKGYMIPYTASGKTLYKVGVQFDDETRTVGEWLVAVEEVCHA